MYILVLIFAVPLVVIILFFLLTRNSWSKSTAQNDSFQATSREYNTHNSLQNQVHDPLHLHNLHNNVNDHSLHSPDLSKGLDSSSSDSGNPDSGSSDSSDFGGGDFGGDGGSDDY